MFLDITLTTAEQNQQRKIRTAQLQWPQELDCSFRTTLLLAIMGYERLNMLLAPNSMVMDPKNTLSTLNFLGMQVKQLRS